MVFENKVDNFQIDLIFEYLIKCTPKQKRALSYIHVITKMHRKAFPSYESIAKASGSDRRTAIRHVKKYEIAGIIKKTSRSRIKSKSRSTNLYEFTDDANVVIEWLSINKFKTASKKRCAYIKKMWYSQQKCHPTFEQNVTPLCPNFYRESQNLILRSSYIKNKNTYSKQACHSYFNPVLEGLGMPREAMVYATRHFSQQILMEAKDSLIYAKRKQQIKMTPQAYFIGTAKRLRQKMNN